MKIVGWYFEIGKNKVRERKSKGVSVFFLFFSVELMIFDRIVAPADSRLYNKSRENNEDDGGKFVKNWKV